MSELIKPANNKAHNYARIGNTMTVNQLMAKLRSLQKQGYGKVPVHMLAHDNRLGETQGEVEKVFHYDRSEDDYCCADPDSTQVSEAIYIA